ncbi:MAG TPA: adenylate/guanylate cyclase domain-containing protein, partial [Stellaceae bacterium]|nr:adenylate/guanylate cyclase domain-containing protein [Stellaceae bacterium]
MAVCGPSLDCFNQNVPASAQIAGRCRVDGDSGANTLTAIAAPILWTPSGSKKIMNRQQLGAVMDVSDWLRSRGFARYEAAFLANAIDSDVLPELTEDDLEKLGIPLGDRKRFVRAIRAAFATAHEAPLPNEAAKRPHGEQPRKPDAERRHLTVMICDLVGSTALSARLDPEDMRALTDAYHAACAEIVSTYDGFLAEFRGDGILAYFGFPHAHEDDAERTVR